MLEAIEFYKGAKNKHSTALCRCDCGNTRIVRQTRLRKGLVTKCAPCAKKEAAQAGGKTRRRFTPDQRVVRDKRSEYVSNAKKKGIRFELTQAQFAKIVGMVCRYCGATENIGVDRLDNNAGYMPENCAPCCTRCNFAKRDMTEDEFISFAEKIHDYQRR